MFWIVLIAVYIAIVFCLLFVFGNRARRTLATIERRILFFDMIRDGSPDVREDMAKIGALFEDVQYSDSAIRLCDVLFLYAKLTPEGKIEGHEDTFRKVVRDCGAKIVVVASANPSSHYTRLARDRNAAPANVVFTMDRADRGFADFFSALFSKMLAGADMEAAWLQMVPQNRTTESASEPKTLYLSELGKIKFQMPKS